jgi:hypothetical protein
MLGYCQLQLLLLSTHNLVHNFSFFQEQEGWHSFNSPLLSNSLKKLIAGFLVKEINLIKL